MAHPSLQCLKFEATGSPAAAELLNHSCSTVGHQTCISGLVVEYIVAIDVTRVRFPADAYPMLLQCLCGAREHVHVCGRVCVRVCVRVRVCGRVRVRVRVRVCLGGGDGGGQC